MKAFVLPVIGLAVLLLVSLWAGICVRQDTEIWVSELDALNELPEREDWTGGKERIQAVYQKWSRRQNVFHMIMEHQDLAETEKLFAGVLAACTQRDDVEFRILLTQLRMQLLFLSETQQANLKNIF